MPILVEDCVVLIVDLQERMMPVIPNGVEIVRRASFLKRCACELEVPVIATTQNAAKLGGLIDGLGDGIETLDKMSFSCLGSDDLVQSLRRLQKTTVVVAGVESHICISQTCDDLIESGYRVVLASDAIGARYPLAHEVAMARLAKWCYPTVCDAVVYDWMKTADHPSFRTILKEVIALDQGTK